MDSRIHTLSQRSKKVTQELDQIKQNGNTSITCEYKVYGVYELYHLPKKRYMGFDSVSVPTSQEEENKSSKHATRITMLILTLPPSFALFIPETLLKNALHASKIDKVVGISASPILTLFF